MIYDIDSVKSLAMSQLAGLSAVWFYGMKPTNLTPWVDFMALSTKIFGSKVFIVVDCDFRDFSYVRLEIHV